MMFTDPATPAHRLHGCDTDQAAIVEMLARIGRPIRGYGDGDDYAIHTQDEDGHGSTWWFDEAGRLKILEHHGPEDADR